MNSLGGRAGSIQAMPRGSGGSNARPRGGGAGSGADSADGRIAAPVVVGVGQGGIPSLGKTLSSRRAGSSKYHGSDSTHWEE